MSTIDIRQVRMFVAVADALSFTRAAEKLHVAQPWLSVQIRKLEEQVGFQLFFRNRNRGVVLTRQGKEFLEPARLYVEAAQDAAEAAREIVGQQARFLKLGAPDFSGEIPARSMLIDSFESRYPRMEVEIVNAWSSQLLDALAQHEIDMAFTVGPIDGRGCKVLDIARYRWALLVEEEQAADWGDEVPLAAMRGRQIASFRRKINPAFFDSFALRLAAYDIELVPLSETTTFGMRQHVEKAHVPVLVSEWHVPSFAASNLKVVPIDEPDFNFGLHLACRVDDERPTVNALWDVARTFVDHAVDKNMISSAP
ncbi:LysR family transcriptional regulator [Novosphingobium sp. BL-52-GroH]|uniref:LysR family transcriptional regulator n=1 Tax=Novosphingobium sp. BL-52-GroH TaxID=3349877 RepID=UPI00384ADD66